MKFLVDAQLPPLLCKILQDKGIEAIHVDDLPKGDESTDEEIIHYADLNGLIVVSKDADFYHSFMLKNKPRKLVMITTGNIKNKELFDLISLIEEYNFIELSNDYIVGNR
jgi:predicted nuclease of predicted toxin-antitoxin system